MRHGDDKSPFSDRAWGNGDDDHTRGFEFGRSGGRFGWPHHHGKPDTTPPKVDITSIARDEVVDPNENNFGFKVAGKAIGAEGQTIRVEIVDPNDPSNIIAYREAVVHNGHWKVWFKDVFSDPLTANEYSVHASVSDQAGNEGTDNESFVTLCFMAGTLIRTPHGDVPVETLARGDLVTTGDGRAVPVVWLGRQTVSTVFADPLRVLPIRVRAGALGEGLPKRDLRVSPDHALFVGGVLLHAGALVNGTSITREADVPATFTYYHVEVDDHALIFAEDVPAETFIDNAGRLAFDNWHEHEALYPEGKEMVELPFPRAKALRQVPHALREQLNARGAALFGGTVASAA